jgi:hypothetical protein
MSDTGSGTYTAVVRYIVDRNATTAEIVLDDGQGHQASATGSSKREPGDSFDAQLAVITAVGRALMNLGETMLDTSRAIIKERFPDGPQEPVEEDWQPGVYEPGVHYFPSLAALLDALAGGLNTSYTYNSSYELNNPSDVSPMSDEEFDKNFAVEKQTKSRKPDASPTDKQPRDGRGRFARRVSRREGR